MLAKLPETAAIKSWKEGAELPLSSCKPGDMCLGYDPASKDLRVLTLRGIQPAPEEPVIALFLEHYRWCAFFGGTTVFTQRGMVPMRDNPNLLMSYCVVNPKRMVVKTPIDFMEQRPLPGVIVEWDGPTLLWTEGLLVGTDSL